MDAYRDSLLKWFEDTLMNDESVLSFELVSLENDEVSFMCGNESIRLRLADGSSTPRIYAFYDGNDPFFLKLISSLTEKLKVQDMSILETLVALSALANDQFATNSDDAPGIEIDYSVEDEPKDDISFDYFGNKNFQKLSHVEEIQLQQRLTKKLELLIEMKNTNTIDKNCKVPSSQSKTPNVTSIFSEGTTSMILIKEFMDLVKTSNEDSTYVEAIDDNVFNWRVKFFNFSGDSELSMDLIALDEAYGYNYVEMELKFDTHIYPFLPPIATIIRPRMKGFELGKVASLSCLLLSNWNPVSNMRTVLLNIRKALSLNSRIDIDSDMNSISLYPFGAYTKLEHLLFKLGVNSEIPARVTHDHNSKRNSKLIEPTEETVTFYPTKRLRVEENKKNDTASFTPLSSKTYWAKGTGYGYGSKTGNWDIASYLAAQRENERIRRELLEEILIELNEFLPTSATSVLCSSANNYIRGARFSRILEESALIPYIESILVSGTLLEMGAQLELFSVVFKIIDVLAACSCFQRLLLPLVDQDKSVCELLEQCQQGLSIYLRKTNEAESFHTLKDIDTSSKVNSRSAIISDDYATYFLNVIERALALNQSPSMEDSAAYSRDETANLKISNQTGHSSTKSVQDEYLSSMRKIQYREVPDFQGFHFSSEILSNISTKTRIRRLAQDHVELSCNCGSMISWSSSVWIRASETRMDCLQVMISGPEGTPYENGLFLFDVYFPSTYPDSPPQVNLSTTGRNTVRFNPNLYNTGKVCLSLLGTWPGDPSESWNKLSTFPQVLLSIQSLILVPQPYFNEPSYESSMHSLAGIEQSNKYNSNIRNQTVRWAMIDQLSNPKNGFEEVIRLHFSLKRVEITEQLNNWQNISSTDKKTMLELLESNSRQVAAEKA